jgi:hypothetical protein
MCQKRRINNKLHELEELMSASPELSAAGDPLKPASERLALFQLSIALARP